MARVSLWIAGLVVAATACGGADDELTEQTMCGPNARLHVGPGVEPHCDCIDGFEIRDGNCVANEPDTTEPPPTSTDPDCGQHGVFDGRSCDCDLGYTQTGIGELRTCEEIPACQGMDDEHEPNGIPSEAGPWSDVQGPLYACPSDADWYLFPVTAGDRVTVELRFSGREVDLDLFLFGPSSRDPRAFSVEVDSDVEFARFIARADGTAALLVLPYGIGEGAYTVSVDVQEGEPPVCASPGAFCSAPSDCCSGICHVGHCH